jgi:3-oxoacyl-[acyl-carrier-protein] synthase III
VPNAEFSNFLDTNDEWIKSRTGISERRILREPGKASSDMGTEAILEIIRKKNSKLHHQTNLASLNFAQSKTN